MTPSLLRADSRFTRCETLLSQLGVTQPKPEPVTLPEAKSSRHGRGFYHSCPGEDSFSRQTGRNKLRFKIPLIESSPDLTPTP